MGTRNPTYLAFKVDNTEKGNRLFAAIKSLWFNDDSAALVALLDDIENFFGDSFDVIENGCLLSYLSFYSGEFFINTADYYPGFKQRYFNEETREVVFAGASKSERNEYIAFLEYHQDVITPVHGDCFGFCSFEDANDWIVFIDKHNVATKQIPSTHIPAVNDCGPYTPQRIMQYLTEPQALLDFGFKEEDFTSWETFDDLEAFLDLLTVAIINKDIALARKVIREYENNEVREEFSDLFYLGKLQYPSDAQMHHIAELFKTKTIANIETWLAELTQQQ